MDVNKRFSASVLDAMRRDVEEAGGNEVFWAGVINSDGLVTGVTVGARGNEDSVIVNSNTAREGHVLIHNHPSGVLFPSEADQGIAANSVDTSLGFYIVNNDVSDVYVVVEPVKPHVLSYISADEASSYISNGGALARQNPLFEERPSQIKLLRAIASSFNEGKIAAFEAGTGVGKSYAYLIPSMLWAAKNRERVVVSTGTINLQQQLIEKDIPAAKKITGLDVKAVLVKGRQNYLCLRRLEDASSERDLFSEETEVFDKLYEWSKTSPTGSKSDLSFLPPESVWTRINSESDACMGMRCPFREKCFVMKVRKEASDASIIVVNHHLLFADIESRMNGGGYEDTAVLPPYKRIVFDEAHGIEDSATSFFSESITRFKLMKQVNLLYRQKRAGIAGFAVATAPLSNSDSLLDKIPSCVNEIKENFLNLELFTQEAMGNEYSVRIFAATAPRFDRVFAAMQKLKDSIGGLTGTVRELIDGIDEDDRDVPSVWECKTVLRRLDSFVTLCKNFCEWNEHDDSVSWIQLVRLPPKKSGDEPLVFPQFTQTPLDIAHMMNSGVFEPMSSVVCTSATLRTGDNFSYWMRRTGLSFVVDERLLSGAFESPFPYKTNAIFAVPSDAPFPDSPYYQGYVEETLPKLIFAAGGRTLVLFTSYESLRSAFYNCRQTLEGGGISLLKQGDDDRFRLLERFKEDKSSVLFATDSFWEGVDVPGESLSQVVIVKLPFAVPNDPVFAARAEAVERRGGSPFMELSVPQAVIKFRQGFGRLIRRGDDKGVIVVLDRRIVEKRYGKEFTKSVPQTRRMYNPLSFIVNEVEKFFSV